ncbi:hypothetical protein O181_029643 [Austropuccinia psidii MF-1]|uniref:Ribonuclease P protein subunit n=1 Tax=Austropuccinia psidii MF-1 TaxID=1389203 RepID=A0A9Q3CW42_9BASI|nr:hypothetical protein [Austropuccinia psidii MF-1]
MPITPRISHLALGNWRRHHSATMTNTQPEQTSQPTTHDIYVEPKILKKRRKREPAESNSEDVWADAKSLSTEQIISLIVPRPIPNLSKNIAVKVTGRHISLDRSSQSQSSNQIRPRQIKKTKAKRLNKSTTRETKYLELETLIETEQKSYRYDTFIPLHSLWLGYMSELLGIQLKIDQGVLEINNPQSSGPPSKLDKDIPPAMAMQAKLLKADYHGAFILVQRAKNPSLVGLKGIMIQESEQTFKIITQDSKIKVIPKVHCVFEILLPLQNSNLSESRSLVFEIFGNQFLFRPTDRINKKFKSKGFFEL